MPWETLFSVFGVLLAVLAVCALAYWCTRYISVTGVLSGFRTADGGGRLKLLAQMGVGKDARLLVAAVGERCFLLGVTPTGITLLAELSEEESAAWKREAETPERPSFQESLRASLKRKR